MRMLRFISALLLLLSLASGAANARVMLSRDHVLSMTDGYLDIKDFDGLIEFADSLHALFDYESLLVLAQRAYERLPADKPELRAFAQRGMAEAYEGLKQYDRAIATYREIMQTYPESPQAPWSRLGVGRCLIGLGRLDDAISELRPIIEKWPNTAVAAWAEEQTGYAYLLQDKPQEALTYLKRAIYNYPLENHPREMGFASLKYMRLEVALPHLHEAYVKAGDDVAALDEFARLQREPDVGATALYYLAVHHQRLGRYDQAIDLFTRYIEMPDQFFRRAEAHFNRAMCRFAQGQYDQAISEWRYVSENFPLHYLAQEAATWISIAEERKSAG